MENILKALLIIVIILIVVSSFSDINLRLATIPELPQVKPMTTISNINYSGVSLHVPAVDNEGNGVATMLRVESKPGRGGTLVDVNQLLFWVDTQNSIRIAKRLLKITQNLMFQKLILYTV